MTYLVAIEPTNLSHAPPTSIAKMNKAAAERDLYGLLPGLTGELPSELLQLTTSLLAQSRSKASSLKPDEEIARSYVCANIACERYVYLKP
jgi:hypothetical protein